MRVAFCFLLFLCAPISHAQALSRVVIGDTDSLRSQLVTIAREQLRAEMLHIADEHVWLALSRSLAVGREYSVRPLWRSSAAPTLPLSFDLTPVSDELATNDPVRATLAVSLQREVLIATRRLRRGSPVGCDDVIRQFRAIKYVSPTALSASCDIHETSVALRDVAAGDVLSSTDVGPPLAVSAGRSVELSVVANGISVTTTALALTDAALGDHVDVRLQHPVRTLRARVIAPGAVQLVEQGS